MDVSFIIRQRLKELDLEQRDLAAAAQVTESYISQLLTRKKAPPAVERTDLYDRMDSFLQFPRGHLSTMVNAQRHEDLKKKLAEPPTPLFQEVRELIIRKCKPGQRSQIREIFENQAFGELERLVSQTLLEVAKGIAREELKNENWLRSVGKVRRQSYEETRAMILDFLDTDVFNISIEHCTAFLEPVIESWDIDLKTFAVEVLLNKRLASARTVQFRFVETSASPAAEEEAGLQEFLRNPGMSGDASDAEIAFLKALKFPRMRPSALYYYRELQSLRDPLHFPSDPSARKLSRRNTPLSEKAKRSASRKPAIRL
ncbi:MAG TPA: helix-turn-helix transcriptional regulator [Candidatus Sulfotelmatobacter sp.]|nr:helix-turn-helix transcriptional regulator [Candidatus Sulfotelmatobacter sp.]